MVAASQDQARREQRYVLAGIVVMDEAYFDGPGQQPTNGRGTNKTPIIVAMALTPRGKPKYMKVKGVRNVKCKTISDFAHSSLGTDVTLVNDGFNAYKSITVSHRTLTMKFGPMNNPDDMKWPVKRNANAKAFIQGTYHGIKDKRRFQAY